MGRKTYPTLLAEGAAAGAAFRAYKLFGLFADVHAVGRNLLSLSLELASGKKL
jgi:hypothetical protein